MEESDVQPAPYRGRNFSYFSFAGFGTFFSNTIKKFFAFRIFFLDEGFGTLDNNLLDVVMSALERLHSQQLSVGIISHVEELKNRIPVKLIVESAVQGISGTKVRIE